MCVYMSFLVLSTYVTCVGEARRLLPTVSRLTYQNLLRHGLEVILYQSESELALSLISIGSLRSPQLMAEKTQQLL